MKVLLAHVPAKWVPVRRQEHAPLKQFECVDRRLARDIVGHDVKTARQMGWTTIRNGELLTLAGEDFDVFVTVDRNLSFQQNLVSVSIAVVVLQAKTNRLADLRPLVPKLLAVIESARPGAPTFVDAG